MNVEQPNQAMIYQIMVKGQLDQQWTDWFEGLTVQPTESGETLLIGAVIDQAMLHSLLRKVRDLGMPLISVVRLDKDGKMLDMKNGLEDK